MPINEKLNLTLVEETINFLEKRRDNLLNGGINSIPTPFSKFAQDFVGLEPSTYYLCTSYTKGGKTQFISNLLFEALLYCYEHEIMTGVSVKILYFNLEETKQRIMTRLFSWYLAKKRGIRKSPSDLRSSRNDAPISEEVLNLLKDEEASKFLKYCEEHIIFSSEANPTGIYKFCKKYAEEHGVVHQTPYKRKNALGEIEEGMTFDSYTPDNPNEFVFVVIDTINMVESERGYSKRETLAKLSEYCAKYLRNYYGQSPIVIQQQNTDNANIESIKLNRTRPSAESVGDCKNTKNDANIAFGLYSPYKFGIEDYFKYDIRKLKDHYRLLEVLINRDGELGGTISLFFDGATCIWKELPPPTDKVKMAEIYNIVENL